jgi:predicted nucleic acid-binding protein
MPNRALVLDANILIRAVLGIRVRRILENFADRVSFFVPELALSEAQGHLATLVTRRGGDPANALCLLDAMVGLVDLVGPEIYREDETEAKRRLGSRDPDDWPILASALALGCPIWTEDTDFFGCGVATWTPNSVEIFLGDEVRSFRSSHTYPWSVDAPR